MTKIKSEPSAQGAEGVDVRASGGPGGAASRSGWRVPASELVVGETVRWSSGRRRVVRSVTRLPGVPDLVELVFEDWSVVQCSPDAYWKVISSPYDHLTDADINALFGWLCPGRGGGPVDAAGAA